jgi:hypothetical protein
MKIIFILFFLLIGICIPIAYSDILTPVAQVEQPDITVKLVQDAYDTVQNPYTPPLRYLDTESYKQMGYLKRNSSRLPFFGKPANLRRDMWYYYTLMDGIKLPITINKRKCSVSPGCSSVSSGDAVVVDGDTWTVELYEMDMY